MSRAILGAFERKHVSDDKLWEFVYQANQLTQGDYDDWDNNAQALVPLMERILPLAREREDWQVYFYDMAKLFWFVRRTKVNRLHLAFQLAERFHQDYAQQLGEYVGQFGKEWQVNLAADILGFYCEYPQIDDQKMERMLGIYLDLSSKYGSAWNNGNYREVLRLALLNKDQELAKKAVKKLKKAQFDSWCYVCTYARPMLGYHILLEEFEETEDIVSKVYRHEIPAKYRWCFERCQQADEGEMKDRALLDCLRLGKSEMFKKFFAKWQSFYERPEQKDVEDTHIVLFHTLAGDWSKPQECLRLAEKDDRDWREQTQTPLDSLYWALCWYCYFQMLHTKGVERVSLQLGTEKENNCDQTREWTCLEAAAYFEQQADLLGKQMDQARKQFGYAEIKRTYQECFL